MKSSSLINSEQSLRQVVVHMGVDAEQDMTQWVEVRRCGEGQLPRAGDLSAAVELGVQSGQVQVGEDDVPVLHPFGVLEGGSLDGLAHRSGGALVGREEHTQMTEPRRESVQALLHVGHHGRDGRRRGVARALAGDRRCPCCSIAPLDAFGWLSLLVVQR